MSQSCGCYKKETPKHSIANKRYNKWIEKEDCYVGITRSGYQFVVDKDDYPVVSKMCWCKDRHGYIVTNIKNDGSKKQVFIHRYILELHGERVDNCEIDHINGLKYDNRKANLRAVTHCQNMQNAKISKSNTSGRKGVSFSNKEGKWKAYITSNHKKIRLGTFKTYAEAVQAREVAEKIYHGLYARKDEFINNGGDK